MSTPWVSSCAISTATTTTTRTTGNHLHRPVSKFSFETSTSHASDFITAENIKNHCTPTNYSANDTMKNDFQVDPASKLKNNLSNDQSLSSSASSCSSSSSSSLSHRNHHRQYSFEYSPLELELSMVHSNTQSSSSPKHVNETTTTPSKLQNRKVEVDLSSSPPPPQHKLQNAHSFQQPPTNALLSHGFSSPVSTVSSPGSIPSSPGMINYSPKHSKIANTFNVHKNMKNLSLNLNDSNGTSNQNHATLASKRLKLSDSNSHTTASSSEKLQQFNFTKTLLHNNTMYSEDGLQTPSVTHTPTLPPQIPQAQHRQYLNGGSDIETRSTNGALNKPYRFPLEITGLQQALDTISLNGTGGDVFDQRMQPPVAPPFAPNSKASPLSTPPRLQSPMALDNVGVLVPQQHNLPTKSLRNIKKMSIESPLETSFNKSEVNSLVQSSALQSVTYDSRKFHITEELQETTGINAYPNGPRNVLNQKIFLYSDPLQKIDINQFDLVINVAKECTNLSAQFANQKQNVREYVHVPWSHASPISKDLMELTQKIDSFYEKNSRILIHCQCGVSRSACVVVAYYMMKFGLGVNAAYEMLKSGTLTGLESREASRISIDKCERICPNMSLIFELMEFGDKLNKSEFSTLQLLVGSPTEMSL